MSPLELLEQIARETGFTAVDRCQVRGIEVLLPERLTRVADLPLLWVRAAADLLGQLLYEAYYLRQPLRPDPLLPAGARIRPVEGHEHPHLSRLLREANAGSGWLAESWRLLDREGTAGWRVNDGEVTLVAREDEIVPPDGDPLAPGKRVSLRFPKHLPYASLGYYIAVSDAGPARAGVAPAWRIYMNVSASAAPLMLRRVTSLLCRRGTRASLKVLNHPDAFVRPDALVLLIERDAFDGLREELGALLERSSAYLAPEVPAFTKRWMPGIALAEEPAGQRLVPISFGEHRSRLIATGIARAHDAAGMSDPPFHPAAIQRRYIEVLSTLRKSGLDPERLYLNPGSDDIYPECGSKARP